MMIRRRYLQLYQTMKTTMKESFVVIILLVERTEYRVGVPRRKQYKLILDSDEKYEWRGKSTSLRFIECEKECDGRHFSFAYDLPYMVLQSLV